MPKPGGLETSVANITHHLRGINFPATKKQLLDHAKGLSASQPVIDVIKGLEDRTYSSMADVMSSYGKEKAA
ncbi:MAG TPA: DUF2795 domain-containing protein [Nitrospirota bacterium]|jgi:hypothetical protein